MENSDFNHNLSLHYASSTVAVKDIRKLPFQTAYYVGTDILSPLYVLVWSFGIASNIINIVVYSKIGVKDNLTVSFLTLSISDLLYLVLLSPHIIESALDHLVKYRMGRTIVWLFDSRILRYPFYWYAFTFYETSIMINVYISVVRCACVAIPFNVKNMFTARRAIITFAAFFIINFALRFPMFMLKRVIKRFDPVYNSTQIVYKEISDGGLANKINDIFSRNILNWTSFVTVIICLIILVLKLQVSAKFRSSVSITSPTTGVDNEEVCGKLESEQITASPHELNASDRKKSNSKQLDGSTHNPQSSQEANDEPQAKCLRHEPKSLRVKASASVPGKEKRVLSSREAQVVRSVILVASIFITCQTPLMAYSLARRIEPQFSYGTARYVFLFDLCSTLSTVFALMNVSVNIVVYYNFNTRYRLCLKSLWKCN